MKHPPITTWPRGATISGPNNVLGFTGKHEGKEHGITQMSGTETDGLLTKLRRLPLPSTVTAHPLAGKARCPSQMKGARETKQQHHLHEACEETTAGCFPGSLSPRQ